MSVVGGAAGGEGEGAAGCNDKNKNPTIECGEKNNSFVISLVHVSLSQTFFFFKNNPFQICQRWLLTFEVWEAAKTIHDPQKRNTWCTSSLQSPP